MNSAQCVHTQTPNQMYLFTHAAAATAADEPTTKMPKRTQNQQHCLISTIKWPFEITFR